METFLSPFPISTMIIYLYTMLSHEHYMKRCIQLALLGKGQVEPNPLVGSVIVLNDSILGEGYHMKYGGPHAEVNAVNSVEDIDCLKQATIYVSLEPCSHFGKTPPCADLIIRHGFKRVVIGSSDPNPEVNGKGIARLREAGIEVIEGILKEECDHINRKFITYYSKNRPYILLKWAQTKDGFMDCLGQRIWISSPEIQPMVHQWRSEYQSILVGRKTVENDDPELTVRFGGGKNPVRIVLDPENRLSKNYKVFDRSVQTIIVNKYLSREEPNLKWFMINDFSPGSIALALHTLKLQSVMIEGGAYTINRFLEADLWDEAIVITGIGIAENGTKAPCMDRAPEEEINLFENKIETYFNS